MGADWIDSLVGLGARIARLSQGSDDRLTIGVTVPTRTAASLLIGLGWLMTYRPALPRSFTVDDLPEVGTRVTLKAGQKVVVETFHGSEAVGTATRIHVGGSRYEMGPRTALVECHPASEPGSHHIPEPGTFLTALGHVALWESLQLSTSPKLTLVGTKSWLDTDSDLEIAVGSQIAGWSSLNEVLHVKAKERATWATEITSAANVSADGLPDAGGFLVLDGHQAATWVSATEAQLTAVVLDRSSPQEAGYFSLLQARAIRTPVSLRELGWPSFPGIEVLAFKEEMCPL